MESRTHSTRTSPPELSWIYEQAVQLESSGLEGVRETPLLRSAFLSEELGREVWLKLENLQATGSFKLRGATARIRTLDETIGRVICASTGNHGLAVASAAGNVGLAATVVAPQNADTTKLDKIRGLGAVVEQEGVDCVEAEAAARRMAELSGDVYLSPYNDPWVVAGQATLGLEIWSQAHEQAGGVGTVVLSLGGGGLAAGVGAALGGAARSQGRPAPTLVAGSPRASAVLHHSLRAGRLLDLPSEETLSDGTAGGVEPGSITFPLCQQVVDAQVLVEESEIARAVGEAANALDASVEGAAGVAVAAVRRLLSREGEGSSITPTGPARSQSREPIVVVICGGNIAQPRLDELKAAAAL